MIQKPRIVEIEAKVAETRTITSLYFHYTPWEFEELTPSTPVPLIPGQFFMVWVPRLDEVPISVSFFEAPDYWGITVKNVGEASGAICQVEVGGYLGIRGPLGNGFQRGDGLTIYVGGGVGLAPLRPAYLWQAKARQYPIVLNCALCGDDLLFHNELSELAQQGQIQYEFATEDGSCGCQGLGTDLLQQLLEADERAMNAQEIICCGPERMIGAVLSTADHYEIPTFQASLERMMRCGMGICGLCVLDPQGLRVCRDGPVFGRDTLHNCTDFCKHVRDFSGHKKDL